MAENKWGLPGWKHPTYIGYNSTYKLVFGPTTLQGTPWHKTTISSSWRLPFSTKEQWICTCSPGPNTCPVGPRRCEGKLFPLGCPGNNAKYHKLSNRLQYPYPYHPCMVYLPTFGGFLEEVYINKPCMDGMGKESSYVRDYTTNLILFFSDDVWKPKNSLRSGSVWILRAEGIQNSVNTTKCT